MRLILAIMFLFSVSFANDYYYSNGEKVYITPVTQRSVSNEVYKNLYINERVQKMKLTENLLEKIRDNVDLEKLQKDFSLEIVKQYSTTLYLVKSDNEILQTANRLYEDERTVFAHPDFIREVIKR